MIDALGIFNTHGNFGIQAGQRHANQTCGRPQLYRSITYGNSERNKARRTTLLKQHGGPERSFY